MIRDAQNQYDDSKKNVQELLQDIREIRNAKNNVQSETEQMKESLGEKARSQKDMATYEGILEKNRAEATNLQTDIFELKREIKENESKIDELQKELERMMRDHDSLLFDSKVLGFINELRNDLHVISEE